MTMTMSNGYSKKEEFYNALTHGIGAALTIPALILLLNKANSTIETVSYTIFGIAMFCMYLCSTLYHSIPRGKTILKKLDHSSIFLLIAGTYTPIALLAIGGTTGWIIFGIEWGLAFIGIIMKQFFVYRFKGLSLMVYIGMGWVAIFFFKPLYAVVGMPGILLLLAGGLAYTCGTYFYRNKNIQYNHAIWHLFVMAGTVAMYLVISLFV